jgi:lantibiotic biosynthesis protein
VPTKLSADLSGAVPEWSSPLTPAQRQSAASVALTLAQRAIHRQVRPTSHWNAWSIAEGDAGIALLAHYAATCTADQSWTQVAHRLIRGAVLDVQQSGATQPGLLDGLAGLGFVVDLAADGGDRYQRLLASIDNTLATFVASQSDSPSGTRDVDPITGLPGVGLYFSQRAERHGQLATLTRLTELLLGERPEDAPAQWFTPVSDIPTDALRDQFPRGYLNCGMAHGIPGILAALARAWRCGVRAPGLQNAITNTATWLLAHRVDDGYGMNWPVGISPDRPTAQHAPTRTAWCYGSPGVACALWASAVALGRDDWRQAAGTAMHDALQRPADLQQIDSPGLCHGVAGLLQIALRFYHATADDRFAEHIRSLTADLLDRYDPATPYGYRVDERDDDANNPGFLEGSAGIAAVLMAASSSHAPVWDRVLSIA